MPRPAHDAGRCLLGHHAPSHSHAKPGPGIGGNRLKFEVGIPIRRDR